MLDDVKSVLAYDYVIKTDRYGKREYIVGPELSWHDDSITIRDRFGFANEYKSGNINIGTNTLFVYSSDRVIQDFYVGYNSLTPKERKYYERFVSAREVQSAVRKSLDLSLLPDSIRVMVGSFVSQLRSSDFYDGSCDVIINDEEFTLSVDMRNLVYDLWEWDEYPTGDEEYEDKEPMIRAYSFESLVYKVIEHLSDRYKFKIDPGLRESIEGVTSLAKVYDFDTVIVED